MPNWSEIQSVISELGLLRGIFLIFFFLTHSWIYKLYSDRLSDRQAEINRLAEDNREYRERFLKILDQQMAYEKPPPPVLPKPQGEKKKKGDR